MLSLAYKDIIKIPIVNFSKERTLLGFYFTLVVPIIFILSLLVTYYNPTIGRFIPLTIPFVLKYGLNGIASRAIAKEKK